MTKQYRKIQWIKVCCLVLGILACSWFVWWSCGEWWKASFSRLWPWTAVCCLWWHVIVRQCSSCCIHWRRSAPTLSRTDGRLLHLSINDQIKELAHKLLGSWNDGEE